MSGAAVPAVAWAVLLVAATASGQTPGPGGAAIAGTLSGVVLDVVTGRPIPGVGVTLDPVDGGLLVDRRSPGGVATTWFVVTTVSGAYRFADLPPGRYRLRLERIGYRGATVEVDLRRPVDAGLSVALELDPVELEPARGRARAASLFHRPASTALEAPDRDNARVLSERVRQSLFLSPDARMVTYADVMDGVTLGEGDVFRTLQRFPGVGTRDDYTAEIWTRGAPWTHTRVTFDGMPLFNPVHAVGMLSAIAPEALGAVFFHPGVRPVSMPEGAAGAVDLRSRAGGGDGSVRGVADLSLATAKLALDQDVQGRGAWLLAGRRSHLGLLSGGLGAVGLDGLDLPYRFHDLAGRIDVELGPGARLEVSGLHEEDRLHGDVEGFLEQTRARWGNDTGRATLRAAVAGLDLSQTVGVSHYLARTDEHRVRTREASRAWTEPASRNEIRHLQLAGTVSPSGSVYGAGSVPRAGGVSRAGSVSRADGVSPESAASDADARGPGAGGGAETAVEATEAARGGAWGWAAGYDVVWNEAGYAGPLPRFHAVRPDTMGRIDREATLAIAGVWAEARLRAGRVSVSPGVRVESGARLANAGSVRTSPRIAARWNATPDLYISAAAGRSWQYTQAIALAGPSIHPAFHASHYWVLADASAPAVRADIVSVGGEQWFGGGWLGSATVFVRRAAGVTVPDPTPGRLRGRPLFVDARNTARGVDASLRRIGPQWSASLGYAYSISELDAAGRRYPSPSDRRHMVDAMAGVRITRSIRLAGAFMAMSGAPFTRAYTRSLLECVAFGFGCDNPEGSWVEEPNAERTPSYRGLDASLHWTRPVRTAELTAYLQVRNMLGRANGVTYAGTVPVGRTETRTGSRVLWDDRFEAGLPRLPLAGVRVTF